MLNKFVNKRPSGWTALSVASPQGCPLQRRLGLQMKLRALAAILIFVLIILIGSNDNA